MAGKEPGSPAAGGNTMSDTQMRFLASMMKNSKAKPDVNWDAVAAENGGITVKACRERYRLMALKFGWNAPSKGGEANSPATPKKAGAGGVSKRTGRVGASAKKGKAKKAVAAENEDDNDELNSNNGDDVMEDESAGEI